LKLQTLSIHQHPPTPLTQQRQVKLPNSPYPQIANLLIQTNGLPINPRNFPIILTPTEKKNELKDSIEEMIREGASKKERA